MISVLNGGIHSSIQDLGRRKFQQFGVIVSGAMDSYALRIANLLVGNNHDEAGIEITFGKTTILFHDSRVIAITGGQLQPKLNGEKLLENQPIVVSSGDILQFNIPRFGGRAYLAISGGFSIPNVLGSKSTYEKARFGGWKGRPIKQNDDIPLGEMRALNERIKNYLICKNNKINWSVNSDFLNSFHQEVIPIRVLPGLEHHQFTPSSIEDFEETIYTVSSHSNRMGYHLESTNSLHLTQQKDILSEAVTFGTIQVPPSGKPMILMADAQTIGGYPKIAQVITADLSRLAQALPGKKVQFKFVDLQTAQDKLFEAEENINQIEYSLHYKINNCI